SCEDSLGIAPTVAFRFRALSGASGTRGKSAMKWLIGHLGQKYIAQPALALVAPALSETRLNAHQEKRRSCRGRRSFYGLPARGTGWCARTTGVSALGAVS